MKKNKQRCRVVISKLHKKFGKIGSKSIRCGKNSQYKDEYVNDPDEKNSCTQYSSSRRPISVFQHDLGAVCCKEKN